MYKVPYAGAPTDKILCKVDNEKQRPLELPLCSGVLRNILFDVCRDLDVHPNDVVGKSRKPKYVRAREEFVWRCRQNTQASFPRIAKAIGRDHSTAVYYYLYRKAKIESGLAEVHDWPRKKPTWNSKKDPRELQERREQVKELLSYGYNLYEISVHLNVSTTIVKNDRRAMNNLCESNNEEPSK